MKNGSMLSMRAGRHRVRPTARALAPDRARAALLGLKPISCAMATMRCRVASDTPGCPFSAYDTAPLDTPALRAMSAIVGRFNSGRLSLPGTSPVERSHATSLRQAAGEGRELDRLSVADHNRSRNPTEAYWRFCPILRVLTAVGNGRRHQRETRS